MSSPAEENTPGQRKSGPAYSPPAPTGVTVVIVNWNTRALLQACLESLDRWGGDRVRQIVVVDNASTDGSAAEVRASFPGVRLIEPGRNTGYAAGNNIGIREAREDYLFLLNPDTEVQPGAIDTLAAFLDHHRSCGVVAPQLYSPGGAVQRSCRSFPTPLALLPELLGLSRLFPALGAYRMRGWSHDTVREVDQPMGSALLVRRQAVDQAGLMDEQFPLFFNEVDWLFRIKQHGWQVWFAPEAQVLHHLGASTRQVRVRAAWQSHTGLHAFYRKHFRGHLNPLMYALIIGAVYLRGAVLVTARLLQQAVRSFRKLPS